MRCPAFVAVLVGVLFASDATAQDSPTLDVASLSLSKKDPKGEFGEGLNPFQRPGLTISLYFEVPGHNFLSLNQEKSELTISDSNGNELELSEGFHGVMDLRVNDEDSSRGTVELHSDTLPARGSAGLTAKGRLVLIAGADPKTVDSPLKIEQGAKVRIGEMDGEVSEVAESYDPDYKQSIGISSSKPFDTIQEIQFVDAGGKIIRSQSAGSGSFGFNDEMTYTQSYLIDSAADSIKIRVTWFTKTEDVTVPADLKIDFGL